VKLAPSNLNTCFVEGLGRVWQPQARRVKAEPASQKIQESVSVPPTSSSHQPEQKGEEQPKERQRKNLLSGVRLA